MQLYRSKKGLLLLWYSFAAAEYVWCTIHNAYLASCFCHAVSCTPSLEGPAGKTTLVPIGIDTTPSIQEASFTDIRDVIDDLPFQDDFHRNRAGKSHSNCVAEPKGI